MTTEKIIEEREKFLRTRLEESRKFGHWGEILQDEARLAELDILKSILNAEKESG